MDECCRADLQVIIHNVQNTMDEFIRTKNNINKIATKHHRVRRTNKTTTVEVKVTTFWL